MIDSRNVELIDGNRLFSTGPKRLMKIDELELKIQLRKLLEKLIEFGCRRGPEFGNKTCDNKEGMTFDDSLRKF